MYMCVYTYMYICVTIERCCHSRSRAKCVETRMNQDSETVTSFTDLQIEDFVLKKSNAVTIISGPFFPKDCLTRTSSNWIFILQGTHDTSSHSPQICTSSHPLVAAVLLAPQSAELPGSGGYLRLLGFARVICPSILIT